MAFVQPFPDDLRVSDHAVVRWLERVCGADIEKIRHEIRVAFHAGGVSHLADLDEQGKLIVDVPEHGLWLLIQGGAVVTILDLSRGEG